MLLPFSWLTAPAAVGADVVRQGGELCVDGGAAAATPADAAARPLHVVETKNRIAKVDGRDGHWVRTYTGGDRYSLVFYDTDPRREVGISPPVDTAWRPAAAAAATAGDE